MNYTVDKITPMVLLTKHDKASEAFGYDLFYTDADMYFEVADRYKKIYLFVPRGFLTDGASIPKPLRGLFKVWDDYYQAAVFHDYLCEYLTIYVDDQPVKISREECDKYFEKIMKHLNINSVKRKIIYAGVDFYSHVASIIYPSATTLKRSFEDQIRKSLEMRDKAQRDQKKK